MDNQFMKFVDECHKNKKDGNMISFIENYEILNELYPSQSILIHNIFK